MRIVVKIAGPITQGENSMLAAKKQAISLRNIRPAGKKETRADITRESKQLKVFLFRKILKL